MKTNEAGRWAHRWRALGIGLAVVGALLLGACSFPASRVQPPAEPRRIGYLSLVTPEVEAIHIEAFQAGLRELGWIEGQNLTIEWRFAGGQQDRLPELAAELASLDLAVIFATSSVSARVAKDVTTTVPIVFGPSGDPVGSGLVNSLARPGNNLTGVTANLPQLSGKQLEYLREVVPTLSRVGVIWSPTSQGHEGQLQEAEAAGRALGLELVSLPVQRRDTLEQAFERAVAEGCNGLLVFGGPSIARLEDRIVELATEHRLPAMYQQRRYVAVGGLIAYGMSVPGAFRQATTHIDKILRGAKPADLPVEQPMRFELIVNQKTAEALGLALPRLVLLDATEVLQ